MTDYKDITTIINELVQEKTLSLDALDSLKAIKKENSTLNSQNRELEERIENLSTEKRELEKLIKNYKDKIKEKDGKIGTMKKDNESLKDRISMKDSELFELKLENTKAKALVELINHYRETVAMVTKNIEFKKSIVDYGISNIYEKSFNYDNHRSEKKKIGEDYDKITEKQITETVE